jgi:hypothetical protein
MTRDTGQREVHEHGGGDPGPGRATVGKPDREQAETTVVLALPRLFVYDVTYLMVGEPSIRSTSRFARSME